MTDIWLFAKAVKISRVKKVGDMNYSVDWKRLLFSNCLYRQDVWLLN